MYDPLTDKNGDKMEAEEFIKIFLWKEETYSLIACVTSAFLK
jgi:hypothetical protein